MSDREEGVSLPEILVAAFLIGLAIVPLLQLYPRTLGYNVSRLDTVLSAVAIRKMEEVFSLLRAPATPGMKFYLHQETSAMPGNWLAKNGVAPEVAANWTTQKFEFTQGAGTFTLFRPGVQNNTTGTPGTTPQGFGWWSDAPLSMTIPAGQWQFNLRRQDTDGGATVRFHVRLYRVPQNTSVAGAVQLFSTTGPNFVLNAITSTLNWQTATVGPFTLASEYLLMEAWLEIVSGTSSEFVRFGVEGSTLAEVDRPWLTTPGGGAAAAASGTAACADVPSCLLVWTIATDPAQSGTIGGWLQDVTVVACQDTNGNNVCDAGEPQVRYDAKITSRP